MSVLYYHKCNDCLTPFSSTEKHIDRCDCDGAVTFMGQVHGDKYVQTGTRPVCDGRCTHAHGPACDCACKGANHGSGRVVTTILREGKVVVVDPSKDIYDDMVRGYKYRELRDYAEGLYTKSFSEGTDYFAANRMRRELDKVEGMRTYDPRQQALINFIVKHKKQTL